MLNSLKSNVNTIFIMLGNKCNFKCRYCLQHVECGLVKDLPNEINEDIYEFIKFHCNNRTDNDTKLCIHFYGGEPLLYYDKIKEIVGNTHDYKNIRYSIITNGSLINKEKVKFFNDNDFNVSISWDGHISNNTRLNNIFENRKLLDNILNLNRLCLSAVLSSESTPNQIFEDFQVIYDMYKKIHGYEMLMNIDTIFDTGVQDKELFNIDYNLFYSQVNDMCDKYFEGLTKNNIDFSNTGMIFIDNMIRTTKQYVQNNNKIEMAYSGCGNGINVLNMDLDGNFYNCHNSDVKTGTIYNEYSHNVKNVLLLDNIKKDVESKCVNCPVFYICRGGCKLITLDKKIKSGYCKLKNSFYAPIIEHLIILGKDKQCGK